MRKCIPYTQIVLIFFLSISNVFSQNIVEEIAFDRKSTDHDNSNIQYETIRRISVSKRIFILTNENRIFDKGDFITLLFQNNRVARAIGAKVTNDSSGIKVIKIFSLNEWKHLKVGQKIGIVRGDDSYFRKMEKKSEAKAPLSKLEDEEDLFNETTLLESDMDMHENKKRIIKTDNFISLNYLSISSFKASREPTSYQQLGAAWAFQFLDNVWAELLYAQSVIKDFPTEGLETKLVTMVARLKYTFTLPFDFYIQPYAGYMMRTPDSPGAGVDTGDNADLSKELKLVSLLEVSQPIFGITLIRRLVPGWFIRLDLGSDLLSAGFALEF